MTLATAVPPVPRAGGRAAVPAPPLLEVRGLRKSFGALDVLDDVSLRVDAGQIVALVGDNGAGKSTLAKCVARTMRADAGQVLIRGEPLGPHHDDAIDAGVGVVWQDLSLCDNLDTVANLYLGRERRRFLLSGADMHREARRALDRLGIDIPDLTRPVAALSGGQRQAIAVARALEADPDVLILDEPTAALGRTETRQVLHLARQLRARGTAILLITHQLDQVFEHSDRIVVLRQGRVAADVVPLEVHPDDVVALQSGIEIDSTASRQLRRLGSLVEQISEVEPTASLPLVVSAMAAAIGQEALCVHLLDGDRAGPAVPPTDDVGDAAVVDADGSHALDLDADGSHAPGLDADLGRARDLDADGGGSGPVRATTTRPSAVGRADGGAVLRRSAAVAVPPPLLAVTDALPVGPDGGPVGLAAASGRVVVSEDVAADPAWEALAGAAAAAGIRSSWAAPIIGTTGVLGTISGYGETVGRPRADQLELITLYAGHAAASIERERLFAESRRRNRVLEAIRAVLEVLAGPEQVRTGLDPALDVLCDVLAAEAATLRVAGADADGAPPATRAEVARGGTAVDRDRLRRRADEVLGTTRSRTTPVGAAGAALAVPFDAPGRPAALAVQWPDAALAEGAAEVLGDVVRSLSLALERAELERARQQTEALRRTQRLQRAFLSRLSHELRTPLTAIHGCVDTLRQPDVAWPRAEQERFLGTIAAESDRMRRLVADLLDASAIDAGIFRVHPDWCDLALVLDASVACAAGADAGRVTVTVDPSIGPVWADHDRLEQVFVNLVENALRHTPPATRVRVDATAGDGGRTVEIRVRDDGPGIDAAVAATLFEPHATARPSGGHGLGLPIARGIALAHGGTLVLDTSTDDGDTTSGASFVVSLPADDPDHPRATA